MPKDGTFDKLITAGPKGAYEIMRVYLKTWRMDTQGGILSDLKAREVCVGNGAINFIWQDFVVPSNLYIRCTKSQNLNVSRLVLHLALPNLLKAGVKSKMKM